MNRRFGHPVSASVYASCRYTAACSAAMCRARLSAALFSTCHRISASNGFPRKSSAPAFIDRTAVSTSTNPVIATMPAAGASFRAWAMTSSPDMSGRLISDATASKCPAVSSATASAPDFASRTSEKCCASTSWMSRPSAGSSSTTRTRIGPRESRRCNGST
ncbi:hypothetical protein O0235_02055 [Tepidiforma flava]|uniref:Uncharacterized protein n=1 Tax=Tepidiforma flava TaxID=3004094 RepID=A0ABY7M9T6_9CHLR|nr:hypothetical protein [Tepidiforma flava]WBL36378.1 hypothetical protein O0235_02055 [Tepidiforma flava]